MSNHHENKFNTWRILRIDEVPAGQVPLRNIPTQAQLYMDYYFWIRRSSEGWYKIMHKSTFYKKLERDKPPAKSGLMWRLKPPCSPP